jgi:secreted trypsin-like serine protease
MYPFQAQVTSKMFCGGVILNSHYILTAAHCLSDREENTRVRVGTHVKDMGGSLHTVATQYQHPKYKNHGTWAEFDISLIKLKSPLTITGEVQKLSLPSRLQEFREGTMCKVSGWGIDLALPSPPYYVLKDANAKIDSREMCSRVYPEPIEKSMICAWSGPDDELTGPCWVILSFCNLFVLRPQFLSSG